MSPGGWLLCHLTGNTRGVRRARPLLVHLAQRRRWGSQQPIGGSWQWCHNSAGNPAQPDTQPAAPLSPETASGCPWPERTSTVMSSWGRQSVVWPTWGTQDAAPPGKKARPTAPPNHRTQSAGPPNRKARAPSIGLGPTQLQSSAATPAWLPDLEVWQWCCLTRHRQQPRPRQGPPRSAGSGCRGTTLSDNTDCSPSQPEATADQPAAPPNHTVQPVAFPGKEVHATGVHPGALQEHRASGPALLQV